jgi:putative PIN family toxin of toxin-antitoxin system
MRVVLDTNVLVSALHSADAVPAQIVQSISSGIITPCFCEDILVEYLTVLNRPKLKFSLLRTVELINKIKQFGLYVSDFEKSSFPLPDEDDRVFYDTAKTCGAILITGNAKHFPQEPSIITPREFFNVYLNKDI